MSRTDRHTPFIGRDDELLAIVHGLATSQTITIVGPGGMGKSTLAAVAAEHTRDHFANGVASITLAGVNNPDELLRVLRRFICGNMPGPATLQQIINVTRDKSMLLVLDRFESLLDSVEMIVALCQASPGLRCLITSRERLRIPGEVVIELRGLSLEDGSAVQAFVKHAQFSNPRFDLTQENRPDIERIVEITGGMPLAIELAAAWTSLLPPGFIADQVQRNIDWLSSSTGITHRQGQSVRAVLDYFWGQFLPHEQARLAKLSVFRGGFTQKAAVAVAGVSPFMLEALVDRSFVIRDNHGRYRFHELLKHYLIERLDADPSDKADTQRAHAQYFRGLALVGKAKVVEDNDSSKLAELGGDLRNYRAAMEWAVGPGGDPCIAIEINNCLEDLFYQHGHFKESLEWTLRIERAHPQPSSLLAAALGSAAFIESSSGNHDSAIAMLNRAIRMLEELQLRGDPSASGYIAELRHNMAYATAQRGEITASIPLYEQALAAHLAAGNVRNAGIVMHHIGLSYAKMADYAKAMECFDQALVYSSGNATGACYTLAQRAASLTALGRPLEAAHSLLGTIDVLRQAGDVTGGSMVIASTLIISDHVEAWTPAQQELLTYWRRTIEQMGIALGRYSLDPLEALEANLQAHLTTDQLSDAARRGAKLEADEALSIAQSLLEAIDETAAAREQLQPA